MFTYRICIRDGLPKSFTSGIQQGIANYGNKLKMIFVVLPNKNINVYSMIKMKCCSQYAIPSQCFQSKHLEKARSGTGELKSIASKVVIQMNAKLGGEPWRIKNPFKQSNTMIVGYDVHFNPKTKKCIGGMVATTNQAWSRFYSTTHVIEDREQFSANLCAEMTSKLKTCV